MAEWIGHLLGGLPSWLFLPVFVLFAIIATVVWLLFSPAGYGPAASVLFRDKKANLGESKKHGKK